jgi:hypothetical protein
MHKTAIQVLLVIATSRVAFSQSPIKIAGVRELLEQARESKKVTPPSDIVQFCKMIETINSTQKQNGWSF